MSKFDWFRRNYGVDVKRGTRVKYTGSKTPKFGTVTSTYGSYLQIRLDGERNPRTYHPTWELEYLPDEV